MFTRSSWPLLLALAASLAIHVGVIAPAVAYALGAGRDRPGLRVDLKPEDLDAPEDSNEPPDQPRIRLGLDAQTASTLTWVGYDEYVKHLAALAEVEQAAFTTSAHSESQAQHFAAPSGLQESATSSKPEQSASSNRPSRRRPVWDQHADAAALEELIDQWMQMAARQNAADAPRAGSHPSNAGSTPRPESAAPSAEKDGGHARAADATASAWDRRDAEPGEVADKQSPASSVVDVPRAQWQLGQPLAAQGLEVKPRRPDFTLLTLMTAAPANPLCEIDFDRDGVPVLARLVKSTGDTRVDSALLASLYRWRASGKALAALTPDATLRVSLRILLTRSPS